MGWGSDGGASRETERVGMPSPSCLVAELRDPTAPVPQRCSSSGLDVMVDVCRRRRGGPFAGERLDCAAVADGSIACQVTRARRLLIRAVVLLAALCASGTARADADVQVAADVSGRCRVSPRVGEHDTSLPARLLALGWTP